MDKIAEEIYRRIKSMELRGAENIAVGAVNAIQNILEIREFKDNQHLISYIKETCEYIKSARPSAVSLPNAVDYILYRMKQHSERIDETHTLKNRLVDDIKQFIKEIEDAQDKIAKIGARRIQDGDVILTHCHSSTAVGIIIEAWKSGKNIAAVATETRPWGQGYITAQKIAEHKIPVTFIIDSAVRYMIKKLRVTKVIVGADTVTVNGAVVNKIGTSQVALSAKEARIPVYVATQTLKFDPKTIYGEIEEIEERSPEEITKMELPGVKIRNPVFDITPANYIDLIISEIGIFPPQYVVHVLRDKFGWRLDNNRF